MSVAVCLALAVPACSAERGPPASALEDGRTPAPRTAAASSGGRPTSVPSAGPSEAAPVASTPAVAMFVEGLASADPGRRRQAVAAALPGSPAHAYASFQVAQAEAVHHAGVPLDDADVREVPGGFALCYADDCVAFTGFALTGDPPLIVTFDVASRPVGEHVVGAGGTTALGDAAVEMVGALEAADGSLVVAVRIRTGAAPLELNLFVAEYRGPDGAHATASDAIGPVELPPHAAAPATVVFTGAQLGGLLTLEAYHGGARHRAQLDVPAPDSR